MKKFLFIAGLILFIGPIILLPSNYEKYGIQKYGYLVKMRIERLPGSCIGAKVRYSVTFSYNEKLYKKQTRGDFCEKHHIGELVDMRMRKDSMYILYPHESAFFDLRSCFILSLFGLILSITQLKKIRNEK
jgi:hypothetical protein